MTIQDLLKKRLRNLCRGCGEPLAIWSSPLDLCADCRIKKAKK